MMLEFKSATWELGCLSWRVQVRILSFQWVNLDLCENVGGREERREAWQYDERIIYTLIPRQRWIVQSNRRLKIDIHNKRGPN